jgi:hypothetical protein
LVAGDSKDEYYNSNKYNIKSFKIQKIELFNNNTRAKVTILAKVTLIIPEAPPMDFEGPATSSWKIEKGQWFYHVDPPVNVQTPFGILNASKGGGQSSPVNMAQQKGPDIAALQEAVRIDRNSLVLTSGAPPETVTISNGLPGGADLEVQSDLTSGPVPGLSWELEKKHIEAGEKTVLRFQATGNGDRKGVVHLLVSPTAAQLDIAVTIK